MPSGTSRAPRRRGKETLEKKRGACRDFAMVFIEAARYLGFGARFVSGYLYDPALDKGDATQAVAATQSAQLRALPVSSKNR